MKAHLGWSKRADGSCLLSEEATDMAQRDLSSVLVVVQGPCPVKSKIELVDRATVQVILAPLNYPPGGESDVWAYKLEQLLQKMVIFVEEYPRTLIQVSIQPLNVGANFLSTLVNAVFLALLDSSVPLKRPFVGVSVRGDKDISICDANTGAVLLQECEGELPLIGQEQVAAVYSRIKEVYCNK